MLANTQPSDTLQHLLDLLFFLNNYLLKIIYSFFFFFLAVHWLSLVAESGGCSLDAGALASLQWLPLLQRMGLMVSGLQ